jgi:nucleotide-binding universal stress UspA family protein
MNTMSTTNIRRILLTTDFSDCAWRAYGPAADLARRLSVPLDVAHVVEHPLAYDPAVYDTGEKAFATLRAHLKDRLAEAIEGAVFHGIDVSPHLLEGWGPDAIESFVEEHDVGLVVQASHGYTGWRHLLLGSFAERVLRLAPAPVLTIPGGGTEKDFHPRRILLPHDLSDASAGAAKVACLLAKTYDARVLVIHVWQSLARVAALYGIAGPETVPANLDLFDEELPERLRDELRARAERELEGVVHEEKLIAGSAAPAILECASDFDADVITMATHGRTGLKHVILGSVAEKVARQAGRPTVTVRPADKTAPR